MSINKFIAIDGEGNQVARYPSKSLGVVPIITTRYLSFEDLTWSDIARISRRAVARPGCYSPRLGESKSIELTNGFLLKVAFVGLNKSFLKNGGKSLGFTFQVVEGLPAEQWSNSRVTELYEKFPDELRAVMKDTYDGDLWLPKQGNIIGPIAQKWYDYYMYNNTSNSRRIKDNLGNYLGYWTDSITPRGRYVIGSDGEGFFSDSESDKYVYSLCFAV